LSQGSAFNHRNAPKSVASHLPQAIGLTRFTEVTMETSLTVSIQWPRFYQGSVGHDKGVFVRCVPRRLASDSL